MPKALNIIKEEHRSLAAVLHGLVFIADEIAAGRMRPDFVLLHAMLRYLKEFPDALHHPKEDLHLHPCLRARSSEAARMLEFVEEEHRQSPQLTDGLIAALDRYEQEGTPAFDQFAKTVKSYAEFQWRHIEREENELLPLAQRVLLPEDWAQVEAAFGTHRDPLGGVEANTEFRLLFRKIANLTPAPVGLGPARSD
ncbi:MAG TPA: hemerythrin domain-containing protein [Rhodocyclaceae bacterium]|nr:hemerythrin domain-containing protein [Rhodocyclaceae bacterium]